jgi:hypothetical protein
MPAARYLLPVLILLAVVAARPAVTAPELPAAVAKQITKDDPGARILRRSNLSPLCTAVPDEASGVMSADFDGDGNDDYAVLVNLGRSKEKPEPGETLFDVALFAFMAEKGGGFRRIELDRYEGFSLAFWLREEPEGELLDEQRGATVTIPNTGIYVDYCGGGTVHYWQGGKFNTVETSD